MTDTHTHIYMAGKFAADSPDGCRLAADRAESAGVGMMVLPAVDRESAEEIVRLHRAKPDTTRTAFGLHPTEAGADWKEELADIRRTLEPTGPVAVGETGIDLYWTDANIEEQKAAFTAQLELGRELGLPVIIHCREGLEVCLDCIRECRDDSAANPLPGLIFHSFTGSPEDVRKIREVCDPYFGINGVVTFKNSGLLPDAVREIGTDRLLLETDSPYLAPVPKRGQRNESSYLHFINSKVAEILGISPKEAEEATDRNAKRIFKI